MKQKRVEGEKNSEQPEEEKDSDEIEQIDCGKESKQDEGNDEIANFIRELRSKKMEMEKSEAKRKEANPDEPLPPLKNLQVVATIFSYYGYLGEEQNVLQFASQSTRAYAKSTSLEQAKGKFAVHRFAPYYDWPN